MRSRTAAARIDEVIMFLDAADDRLPRSPRPGAVHPALATPFTDAAAGQELPRRTVRLICGDLVNYADVSGDPHPIHWSDRIAGWPALDNVVTDASRAHNRPRRRIRHGVGRGPGSARKTASVRRSVFFAGRDAARVEFTGRNESLAAPRPHRDDRRRCGPAQGRSSVAPTPSCGRPSPADELSRGAWRRRTVRRARARPHGTRRRRRAQNA